MARLYLLLMCCFCAHLTRGQGVEWLTDAPAAQARAKAENKLVMLDFTGSDWCGWCMKLKREVFDQPDFARFAQSKLVLVEVDFPRAKAFSAEQRQANERLAQTYKIGGFPTLILLDGDGKQLGTMGYVPGGPSAFIATFEKITASQPQVGESQPAAEPDQPRKSFVWTPPPGSKPVHYGALALKSVSGTKERRIVQINNATMMTGETAKVRSEDHDVLVICKEIRQDSVLITCDGTPMELKLAVR